MEFTDLKPGPDYAAGLAASLAHAATLPGVVDRVMTCDKCGAKGRAAWSPILPLDAYDVPPAPLGWECQSPARGGGVTCAQCFGHLLDDTLAAMRAWINTPAGRAQLLAERRAARLNP